MTVLAFDSIRKSYGDHLALDGVSLEVGAGEVFGLLGPNGAGKTTLIRILMDIIRPDSGTISLFGKAYHRDHLDRLSYLPEERGLYIKHKVIDVLTYFGSLKGFTRRGARERGMHWLQKVGLEETANWKVSRLSKGMSQKVQIAATLLAEPQLCVLDEPFSGLDPLNVRLVQELIHERTAAGLTTILSTHQMNLVETVCHRVALIHKGQMKEYGTVGDVRRRHSLPEVRVSLTSPLPPVEGVEQCVEEGKGTWRMRLKDGKSPAALLTELVHAGATVEHFEKVLTPMEDVFVRVVEGGGK